MMRKIRVLLPWVLSGMLLVGFLISPGISTASASFAAPKPTLNLNLVQGPLGVTLALSGRNYHPGLASAGYTDSQGNQGTLGTSSIQVQSDGSFANAAITLPTSGPAGNWKIGVTDSAGASGSAHYTVLTAPGQSAGAPSLTVDPTTAASGATITFSGGNWLPQGTMVNLSLVDGATSTSLLPVPAVSDANGMISGTFRLPTNLGTFIALVSAADTTYNALRAQAQIMLTGPSPIASPSPTMQVSPTPTVTATVGVTPTAHPSPTSGGTPGSTINSDRNALGIVFLVVGGTLGIAALMLILFLIPWGERRRNLPPGRQY